jgi:hypothetical protein
MVSNGGDSSASALKSSLNGSFLPTDSFLHRLPYRTDLVAPTVFLITPRDGPRRQHTVHSRTVIVFAGTCLPSHSIAAVVYYCLLRIWYRCLFRDRHPTTGLYAIILYIHNAFTSATHTCCHLLRKTLLHNVWISHRSMNPGSMLKI